MGDFGVPLRNMVVTTVLMTTADVTDILLRRKNPSRIAAAVRSAVRSMLNPEAEFAEYRKVKTRPMSYNDAVSKLALVSPHDVDAATREDLPTGNIVERWPWFIWPTLMGIKIGVSFLFPPTALVLAPSVGSAIALMALSLGQKKIILALDRGQRAYVNSGRAAIQDMMVSAMPGGVASANDLRAFGKAASMFTGRGTGGEGTEKVLRGFGPLFLAIRFYLSQIQMALGVPIYSDAFGGKDGKMSSKARAIIAKNYRKYVYAQAVMIAIIVATIGKANDDDEESIGIVLNPWNPLFGRVRLSKNVYFDQLVGLGQWVHLFAKEASGYVVRPTEGEDYSAGDVSVLTPREIEQSRIRFIKGRLNPVLNLALDSTAGEFMDGTPAVWQNTLSQTTDLLIIRDAAALYEETDPTTATALLSLLWFGLNVKAGDYKKNNEKWQPLKDLLEENRETRENRMNDERFREKLRKAKADDKTAR